MAGIVAGCLCAAGAFAQTWPGKPIRIVSGFATGGGVDIMARVLPPKLLEAFDQQILIDSRPGAGTNIAIEHVIKSPPGGYTLLMSSPPVATNTSLYRKLSFDTTRDLATIAVFSQRSNPRARPISFAGTRTWAPSPSATCRRTQPGSCATKSPCGLRWSRLPEHRQLDINLQIIHASNTA